MIISNTQANNIFLHLICKHLLFSKTSVFKATKHHHFVEKFFVCKHSKRNDQGIEVMTTRRLYLTCICFLCFPSSHTRCSLIVAKKSKVFGRGVSSNNNVYLIALKVRNHLFTMRHK